MTYVSRRTVLIGAAATLAACDTSFTDNLGPASSSEIDTRVDRTLDYMYSTIPETKALAEAATGMLVMPLINEAGLLVGGSYGEGALLIDGLTVDYYSATQASIGLQAGVQSYAHTLFFMTPDALRNFRTEQKWTGGIDSEFVLADESGSLNASTAVSGKSVIAVIFAQTGLRVGATLEGTRYARIAR